jgi:hypothetical protein
MFSFVMLMFRERRNSLSMGRLGTFSLEKVGLAAQTMSIIEKRGKLAVGIEHSNVKFLEYGLQVILLSKDYR